MDNKGVNPSGQKDQNDVVILELDRPRELRLGHKALKRFSALTGASMADMKVLLGHYDSVATLLYVMLSQDDKDLTPEGLDDLIDQAEREGRLTISQMMDTVAAAVIASFGSGDEAQDTGETPPTAAGTGGKA